MASSPDSDRFPLLDGLRGLAAVMVLGYHIVVAEGIIGPLAHGYLAVDFFFALSGFVIASAYEQRLRSGRLSLKDYAVTRLIRLYPMLTIGLLFAAAASLASGAPLGGSVGSLLLVLLAEELMIPSLFGHGPIFLLNGPQWSLFLEMAANAWHALFVKQLGAGVLIAVIAICAALLVWIGLQHHGLNMGWRTENLAEGAARTLFSFFVGLGVQRLRAAGRLPKAVLPWWAITALLAAAIGLPNPPAPLAHGLRDILIVLALFPFLLANAVSAPLPRRLVPLAAWAGFVSYPLYLLHTSVLELAAPVLAAPATPKLEKLLGYAAVAAACLLLSWAAGKWAEEPIRRRLMGLLKRSPAPIPAA